MLTALLSWFFFHTVVGLIILAGFVIYVGLILYGFAIPIFGLDRWTRTAGVQILDGDTVRMMGRRVRIRWMDAPEMGQTMRLQSGDVVDAGVLARDHLVSLVGGRAVRADLEGQDVYRRDLAILTIGEVSLGLAMVQDGWAIATNDAPGEYHKAMRAAQNARRGMWASQDIENPALWRRANPHPYAGWPW